MNCQCNHDKTPGAVIYVKSVHPLICAYCEKPLKIVEKPELPEKLRSSFERIAHPEIVDSINALIDYLKEKE